MFDITLSLVYQIIGFLVLLFILNRFLYTPVLRVLREREERIGGTLKKTAKMEKDIEEGLAAYEKRLKEATVKGFEQKNRLRQEALEKEKAILDAARNAATAELGSMKKELEKSRHTALAKLKEETKSISREMAEKVLERKVVAAIFMFIVPLIPALLFAAEEEGGGEGGGMEMIWKTFNFAVLAIGIYLVWKKVIKGLLEKRGVDIKKALEDAKAARDAADRKASEYSEKLALLEKKVAEINTELMAEGEAEKKRILLEAENIANKIKEQARLTAAQEVNRAKLEIRKEVAEIAVKMAEEILKKELSADDQKRLLKGYLNNLRLN